MLRLLTLLMLYSGLALAQPASPSPGPPSAQSRQAEAVAAWQAAQAAATPGPASVTLSGEALLQLPKGMVFIPQAEAARVTRAMGSTPGPNLVGIVTNFEAKDDWIVLIRWQPDGYIRDDEAAEIKPDAVLQDLREGTEESNKDRIARGFPELELTGWTQPPVYDPAQHRLSWAMGVKAKDETDADASINFNTRALGRNGYFSLNLISDVSTIDRNRVVSDTLLGNLDFDPGHRYADFNGSTDKVATYGLMALLGVVAAKKLGLIALAGVFVLKFAKVGLLALAGGGLALRKMFGRKSS